MIGYLLGIALNCRIFNAPEIPCQVEFRLGPAPVVVVTEAPVFVNSFE